MLPNEMEILVKQRQEEIKKKKTQVFYGAGLLLIVFITCGMFWRNQYRYAICLGVGTLIGITLRYSRFCFTAAFRDPFVSGNTRILRGIILAMIISTIGFAFIQANYIHNNGINYDLIPGAVSSVGIHVMIGAFLFGIGMVLAGGCASSVLLRIGEGHISHWIVLLGFIIGTLLGAKDYSFWYDSIIKDAKTIYFLEYMDLKIVTIIQIIVLVILYQVALLYEKRHMTKL